MEIETKWQCLDDLRNSICEKYSENKIEWIEKELGKNSEEKKKAMKAGLMEPFLVLVTMSAMQRLKIAAFLGWSNVLMNFFQIKNENYVHEEVWNLLNANFVGILARTNKTKEKINPLAHNCTWYEILERTCKANFKTCTSQHYYLYSKELALCQTPNNIKVEILKKEWLERLWFYKINNYSFHEMDLQSDLKVSMKKLLDPNDNGSSIEAYKLPFLLHKAQEERKKEFINFISNSEQRLLTLVQAQLAQEGIELFRSTVKKVGNQLAKSNLIKSLWSESSIIAKFSKNLFGPGMSDTMLNFISQQIARTLMSVQGSVPFTVAEISAFISATLVPVIDVIFAIILLYQILTLFIGSSPERLLFPVETILIRGLELKEGLLKEGTNERKSIDINDYFIIGENM